MIEPYLGPIKICELGHGNMGEVIAISDAPPNLRPARGGSHLRRRLKADRSASNGKPLAACSVRKKHPLAPWHARSTWLRVLLDSRAN